MLPCSCCLLLVTKRNNNHVVAGRCRPARPPPRTIFTPPLRSYYHPAVFALQYHYHLPPHQAVRGGRSGASVAAAHRGSELGATTPHQHAQPVNPPPKRSLLGCCARVSSIVVLPLAAYHTTSQPLLMAGVGVIMGTGNRARTKCVTALARYTPTNISNNYPTRILARVAVYRSSRKVVVDP